jgi:acyl-CoA dehydrogenase
MTAPVTETPRQADARAAGAAVGSSATTSDEAPSAAGRAAGPSAAFAGRADLHGWRSAQPSNVYTSNRQLQRLLGRLMGRDVLSGREDHLRSFGEVVAGPLDEAAEVNNRSHNLPLLQRYDALGTRVEDIENHPSYDACGEAIYTEGRVIAVYADRPANLHAQTLFYLSSHVGEAGHNCPVACTAGVANVLARVASPELAARYLPGVLSADYPDRLDGAQFLTEVQGGSDVGANAVVALPDGTALGTTQWRIHGEKWFCSNAAADLILLTARVSEGADGTRGLGLFLVPRLLPDGRVNDFRLRRLKDKLGTRSMPSAEIDFDGALAYAVGEVRDGFTTVMNHVINTSRLYNTVGCAGIARRAHLVAEGYARHRRAFGTVISTYPMVQEMLASTRATSAALLAGALELAHLHDDAERGDLGTDETAFLRVGTNLAKMRSCQHSHRVVLTAIETLGGNGAIESFSVLPRLLRDNVVYENWEGTHNTLVAQTVRDFARGGMLDGFVATLRTWFADLPEDLATPAATALDRALDAAGQALAAGDPGVAGLMLKPQAELLADILFYTAYARDVAAESDPDRRVQETAALQWFAWTYLAAAPAARDQQYAATVARVAATTD